MIARRALVALVALSVLAACSDDDDATDPTTTDAPAASDSVTSTDAPTTTEATTTTTTPPPTTSPEEALKAQIAEDYMASEEALYELVNSPSLDQLAERVALVAASGSAFFDLMVARVTDLVDRGEIVTANDPNIDRVEIEQIEVLDADSAVLTVCRVSNLKTVTPGASSTGEDILVPGTGDLVASRSRESVALTSTGWLRDNLSEDLGAWPRQEQCEPA